MHFKNINFNVMKVFEVRISWVYFEIVQELLENELGLSFS